MLLSYCVVSLMIWIFLSISCTGAIHIALKWRPSSLTTSARPITLQETLRLIGILSAYQVFSAVHYSFGLFVWLPLFMVGLVRGMHEMTSLPYRLLLLPVLLASLGGAIMAGVLFWLVLAPMEIW